MRQSARVFASAVLSECVTLAFRSGLEKTMAGQAIRTGFVDRESPRSRASFSADIHPWGTSKKVFTNWLMLSGLLQYATLCGLATVRPSVTKPLRREHTSIRPPKELSRREGNCGRKGAAREKQSGPAISKSPTLGNLQRKWPLAAGTV